MPATKPLPTGRNLFFWKKRSVTITEYDPSFKVHYIGNIVTPLVKGEGCEAKPLKTLWKVYTANPTKLHIPMELTVCDSGMKVITKKHGLTEYWAYRVTYCCAPKEYPGVFCWMYRHEGTKMKQEYRFHAAVCPKAEQAQELVTQLNSRLAYALQEFRREKLNHQKARLSLANSCYDYASMPRRKLLLCRGSINFRPPVEMSKIAPKLTDIEESFEEEEEEAKFFNSVDSMNSFDDYICFGYSCSTDSESSSVEYGLPDSYTSVFSLNSLSDSSTSSCDEQSDDSIVDLSEHALLLS